MKQIDNENMKSSCNREDYDVKKKYVFFSDPDVTDKLGKTSDAPVQTKEFFQVQRQCHTTEVSARKPAQLPVQLDLKNLEHLLSYHPVQPYPFTFISAVKRKLALGDHADVYKKAQDPCLSEGAGALNSNNKNLYEVVQKMNFIRPLKAPDLKISLKTLDLSNQENSLSKELSSTNFDILSKELAQEKTEKSAKQNERVQRKLDFSSEGASLVSNDSIEPLKVPNVSIASNLSKKKEHIRESFKEKENRSKRIRKDESLLSKKDNMDQEITKQLRSPRHTSKKTVDSITHTISDTKSGNDKSLFHTSGENNFGSTKIRSKNFATSTAKKDTDKRYKSYSVRSAKLSKDNYLGSKTRACSNEFLSQSSIKVPENVTIRESTKNFIESREQKHHESEQYIYSLETRQMKRHKMVNQLQSQLGNESFEEQIKWPLEKTKQITNKINGNHHNIHSEEIGGIVIMEPNAVIQTHDPCSLTSAQLGGKESEKPLLKVQNINSDNFDKNLGTINYINTSTIQHNKKDEGSVIESSVTLHKPISTSTEGNDLNNSIVPEALLDPRRISFRDENRSQKEFCDLVTPDVDLINRIKRKKSFVQENVSEPEALCSKCNPVISVQTEQKSVQLLHPSALHMQFQTELHLLDSFNESIRRVMDVEKCLCNVENRREKEQQYTQQQSNEDSKCHFSTTTESSNVTDSEYFRGNSNLNRDITKGADERPPAENKKVLADDDAQFRSYLATQPMTDELEFGLHKIKKRVIQVVEVQTQTVNDIATQTDTYPIQDTIQDKCLKTCEITCEQASAGESEMLQLSLDSAEQFEDLDQIDEISLPSKIRTLSEISLHETTSSIRTETGTEISISTRDVTCSFNKYLDLEIAQLIKDEKQRFDKIEMLFKSREKTLNDRTKKLVKLEEQKRALRDTGQDSRISSVKKKQRALLLKLQQEKDEMNRLKELHKIASQERKLMLQKQRNMFNPQMSTKNILTKLKRSADSQSPRRLSGPMKGYDIRSNSSMSSLVDSDKSQQDQSQADTRPQMSDNDLYFSKLDLSRRDKFTSLPEESNTSLLRCDKSSDVMQGDTQQEKHLYKFSKADSKAKYEIKSNKFEEKMPNIDVVKLKTHQFDVESKLNSSLCTNVSGQYIFQTENQSQSESFDKIVTEYAKSESDTLVEELSKKLKNFEASDSQPGNVASLAEVKFTSKNIVADIESRPEQVDSSVQGTVSKTSKLSQVTEDILQTYSKHSKKSNKTISTDKDLFKKPQCNSELKSCSKRKTTRCQKSKSLSSILTENILRSKSSSQVSEEYNKHNKRTRVENEFVCTDKTNEIEEDSRLQVLMKHPKTLKVKNSKLGGEKDVKNMGSTSGKSQINSFAMSYHSSGNSENNYSKSVVFQSPDQDFKESNKLEEILNAREAALASRKTCVEEWMAWHAKLRAEENRVAQMEQAALKLVTATSNVLSRQERSVCTFIDTTVSSDTSDIESRIEQLTEKLAKRRIEMSQLKREARKQTKQKLRDLETNLLNQIKKYDTTIYEMRKKLEFKKGILKDTDKLAIESKSLADFKVPEIPLKRIQDIYKSSDLLRSRSESDLLSTKKHQKEIIRSVYQFKQEDKNAKHNLQKSEKSLNIKGINTLRAFNSVKSSMTHNDESILDECASEKITYDKHSAIQLLTFDEDHSDNCVPYKTHSHVDEMQDKKALALEPEETAALSMHVPIHNDVHATLAKSETDVTTEFDIKTSEIQTDIPCELEKHKTNSDMQSEQYQANNISSQSGTPGVQDMAYPQVFSERHSTKSSIVESNIITSDSEVHDFSKKLDFLRLNNKNLNENISSLENELKVLSEMMSCFSKKSGEISDLHNDERSTSKDVSDVLLKSNKSDEISGSTENDEVLSSLDQNQSNLSQLSSSKTGLKTGFDFSENKDIVEEIDTVMSTMIPDEELSFAKSIQEIDYRARSKEILKEIEKSIISERIKSSEIEVNYSSSHMENNSPRSEVQNEESLNTVCSSEDAAEKSKIISESDNSKGILSGLNNQSNNSYSLKQCLGTKHSQHTIHDASEQQLLDEQVDLLTYQSQLSKSHILEECTLEETTNNLKPHSSSMNSKVAAISSKAPCTNIVHSTFLDHSCEILETNNSSSGLHEFEKNTIKISAKEPVTTTNPEFRQVLMVKDKDELDTQFKKESEGVEYREENQISNSGTDLQSMFETSTSFSETGHVKEHGYSIMHSNDRITFDKDDLTVSVSLDLPQSATDTECKKSENHHLKSLSEDHTSICTVSKDLLQIADNFKAQEIDKNLISDVDDVSLFVPIGESTNLEIHEIKHGTETNMELKKSVDDSSDIDNIITKDNKVKNEMQTITVVDIQNDILNTTTKMSDEVENTVDNISKGNDSMTDFEIDQCDRKKETAVDNKNKLSPSISLCKDTWRKEKPAIGKENDYESTNTHIHKTYSQDVKKEASVQSDKCTINITVNRKIVDDEDDRCTKSYESKEAKKSIEERNLSELEVDAEIDLGEDLTGTCNLSEHSTTEQYNMKYEDKTNIQLPQVQTQKSLDSISEQDCSDGEQLDNLVEVTESSLDVIEKESEQISEHRKGERNSQLQIQSIVQDKLDTNVLTYGDSVVSTTHEINAIVLDVSTTPNVMNKTFDIVKDPEYEDISEESLEVSEILDRSETQKSHTSQKSSVIPEKYQAAQKSEDVLRILDEISQKHLVSSVNASQKCEEQLCDKQRITNINEPSTTLNKENNKPFAIDAEKKQSSAREAVYEEGVLLLDTVKPEKDISQEAALHNSQSHLHKISEAEKENASLKIHEELLNARSRSSHDIYSMQEEGAFAKDEQDMSSDFSEEGDTPRGVSEIEMDLPRDANDSRLDIDALDDDLLTTIGMTGQNIDSKSDFHAAPIVTTSEKDIEIMIEKLKASLEQPGLEVAELEAKLLRIEQLQIELEIKKLEAEEVSYYVREIPNKPPPPYTPPGGVRIPTSLASPSPPPAVIPSNVEELTAFTERATALIYKAKLAGEDIMNLGAPPEIYQLTKENNETAKKDRRIYNTFLFDLCKETVAEIYRSEYEAPGPSWAKPNVKTKPAIKIPRTLDELHDYVCKEVATLFGFKTKLQRENMVMRWSRKRRDRVDELLAREAQAEEDEWTKFHHDESAVKNGLTVAILDTLLTETGNVVKVAYAKKRKIMIREM